MRMVPRQRNARSERGYRNNTHGLLWITLHNTGDMSLGNNYCCFWVVSLSNRYKSWLEKKLYWKQSVSSDCRFDEYLGNTNTELILLTHVYTKNDRFLTILFILDNRCEHDGGGFSLLRILHGNSTDARQFSWVIWLPLIIIAQCLCLRLFLLRITKANAHSRRLKPTRCRSNLWSTQNKLRQSPSHYRQLPPSNQHIQIDEN